MREILTAISFLLVIVAPTVMAARASGMTVERKKKVPKKPPQRENGTVTHFRNGTK